MSRALYKHKNSESDKKKLSKRKIAHPNTYFIGNLASLGFVWLITLSLLWYFIEVSIIVKLIASGILFVVSAWIQHRYLTGITGWVVEKAFSDPSLTAEYEEEISRQKMREEKSKKRKTKNFRN